MESLSPIVKDVVLVGGGHSHALFLRMWGMKPLHGVRLTLISDSTHAPYSGMLPGLIEGKYTFDQAHIDLGRLTTFASARLIRARVTGLDLQSSQVHCTNRPPIDFDIISINTGSIPEAEGVPGAAEHAIAVKPVPHLLPAFDKLLAELKQAGKPGGDVVLVGGGAGGAELALAMQTRFENELPNEVRPQVVLAHSGERLLEAHNKTASRILEDVLRKRGVKLRLNDRVTEVSKDFITCASGERLETAAVFWVTSAAAPNWPQAAGLSVDSSGFIAVNKYLQSTSHPKVFAAGDAAAMVHSPRAKSGVFAVRQAKPLFHNIRAACSNRPLRAYRPQKEYLSLISTGDGKAVASRGRCAHRAKLLWRWKDHIDRSFMRKFSELPAMDSPPPPSSAATTSLATEVEELKFTGLIRCAGCGSKVDHQVLHSALSRAKKFQQETPGAAAEILIGLNEPDDAAVIEPRPGALLVQSIDYFPALLSDPFIFGRITVNHCASDIFAMGAEAASALALVLTPPGSKKKTEDTLFQLLSGAIQELNALSAPLIGGHTVESEQLGFGLVVNGWANKNRLLRKGGMQAGDHLILTKPLGVGMLFAAEMRLKAKARWIDAAIESMLVSNALGAEILLRHGCTSCTDITGFGLAGHALEMLTPSRAKAELSLSSLPLLPGAEEVISEGIFSTMQPANRKFAERVETAGPLKERSRFEVLFDPQTSGGLLASVPAEHSSDCLAELQASGYVSAQVIGRVLSVSERTDGGVLIVK